MDSVENVYKEVSAVGFAREEPRTIFEICLCTQVALIEFARNVAKTPNATNVEFDKNAGINVLSFIKKSREYF